jgi:membrane-associated phospholipid phosphatase
MERMSSFRRSPIAVALSLCLFALVFHSAGAFAQGSLNALPDAPTPSPSDPGPVTIRNIVPNVLHDQAAIWTSPIHIRAHNLVWLVPLGIATGAAIATDKTTLHDVISSDPAFNNPSTNTSNVLIGGFIAAPVVLYGVGHFTQNEHARETGLLGAQSILDGLVVEQGMKFIFWRERPTVDNQRGRFFQSSAGWDSSFPSSHSVIAWATASAIATEYPRPRVQIPIYAAAAGVSFTRLLGQQHFPSDVLVGSAAGWLIGRYVVHHHRRWRPSTSH